MPCACFRSHNGARHDSGVWANPRMPKFHRWESRFRKSRTIMMSDYALAAWIGLSAMSGSARKRRKCASDARSIFQST